MNRKGKICIGVDEYKVINKTRVAEWKKKHPDRAKEIRKKWDDKNRKEYQRAYRLKNKKD